ncbi:hypothetical protein EMCRGX_G018717 [Ephydatia muelleri]
MLFTHCSSAMQLAPFSKYWTQQVETCSHKDQSNIQHYCMMVMRYYSLAGAWVEMTQKKTTQKSKVQKAIVSAFVVSDLIFGAVRGVI